MDLENKYLAAVLSCEKLHYPIKTVCDTSFLSADELCFIETTMKSIMENIDEGVANG